jgi:hypothetical protein
MKPTEERQSAPMPSLQTNDEYWEWWVNDTLETVRAGLRAKGVDERTIDQKLHEIVVSLHNKRYGADRVRNPLADFAPPPPERVVDAMACSDVPIEDQATLLLAFIDEQPTQVLPVGSGRQRTTIPLTLKR